MRDLVLLLVVAALLAPLALASAARSEQRTYVGPTHDTTARSIACAVPAPLAVDGACFRLQAGDSSVDLVVADATGLAVPAHVFFRDASGIGLGGAFVCDATGSWSVPPGAADLQVWLQPNLGADAPASCPLVHGVATVGTITATFR